MEEKGKNTHSDQEKKTEYEVSEDPFYTPDENSNPYLDQDFSEAREEEKEPEAQEEIKDKIRREIQEENRREEPSGGKEEEKQTQAPLEEKKLEEFLSEEEYQKRRAARAQRRREAQQRRKKKKRITAILAAAAVLALAGCIAMSLKTDVFKDLKKNISRQQEDAGRQSAKAEQEEADETSAKPAKEQSQEEEQKEDQKAKEKKSSAQKTMEEAKLKAQMYDYDGAIKLLKESSDYKDNKEMQEAAAQYQKTKESCKEWPIEEVTHVFYHTLIKDTAKAFDGDYKEGDYNQVMTTIDEFNKITQEMYDRGYVMVSIHDLAVKQEDGTMKAGKILLPEGKIPFVLSQDDVCYYHYMEGDGYASKLIVDENGDIKNEYIEDDGTVSVGDYDMVPLIDRFVEEHPDFSYHGAKGIIALTGYNGVLGYRTDISYETRPEGLDANKLEWLEANPDFDLESEREEAKKVADAMKAEGWEFASHTWGHLNVGQISMERLQADTQKFKENVDPIIGGTDVIIFAFGADLTSVEDYSGEKFDYLKGQGYDYYCNVDSSKYFVQLRDNYFRMGRRNLDGYRMYYNPELLEDLFDASAVFDPARPTPVPPMGSGE